MNLLITSKALYNTIEKAKALFCEAKSNDAVRFVLEKAKASTVAIESKEKEKEEDIDIQRFEEEGKQSTAATTNQLFW